MPLKKAASDTAVPVLPNSDEEMSGPLSGPSSIEWRRQRLLQIGSSAAEEDEDEVNETTSLRPAAETRAASYGTLPRQARDPKQKSSHRTRHALALPNLRIPKGRYTNPPTPSVASPRSLRSGSYFATVTRRPVSAYDKPVAQEILGAEGAIKTNGIRVWYSSFTSIDWLHDAIKDSARQARLRKHKSKRGRVRKQLDRSVGWITVTLVGFFTAIIAFMIVRGEQWLFDIKEGYCTRGLWKAKRFCCPIQDDNVFTPRMPAFMPMSPEESCVEWRTWGEYFASMQGVTLEQESIEYVVYTVVAVCIRIFPVGTTTYYMRIDTPRGHLRSLDSPSDCIDFLRYSERLWRAVFDLRQW